MNKLHVIVLSLLIGVSGCSVLRDVSDATRASGSVGVIGKQASLNFYFSDDDRRHILSYFKKQKKKGKKMPPGLAKRNRLPPGLEKQIVKNGQLPPGLRGRGLPGDLEHLLSPLPAGYVRLIADKSIVLMNKKSGIVVDLMVDVVL